jgi:transposase
VSHHSPAVLQPDRYQPASLRQGAERMPILADLVQVVIGVDTHKHTHTAAV